MRTLLLLLLVLAGCSAEPGRTCQTTLVGEHALDWVRNVPVVTVQINGQPARLILDTGSDGTVLNRAAARRLGVPEAGSRRMVGTAGGLSAVGAARLDTLVVAGRVLRHVPVLLADAPGPPIDGVLGIDVLVGFELELDVPARRAVFYEARTCIPALPVWSPPYARLVVQQRSGSGHLSVPVSIDGQPLRGMLDTGASGTVLSLQAAQDLGISRHALARLPGVRSETMDPQGVPMRMVRVREMQVGTDRMEAPVLSIANLPPFAGDLIVGEDYLGTRRFWFSFAQGQVYVRP